jgi:UDP-glucose 4-epimerase
MQLLVTGASGFVGGAIVERLARDGHESVRGAIRREVELAPGVVPVRVPALSSETDWSDAVRGVDTVVHAAARVHVMHERATDPLAAFRAVNVAGTLALARQAASAGVGRFVFISSIKVNGEETLPGRAFTEHDTPAPADAYGLSKLEAEQGLRSVAASTGLEVVIIRPVLVYGPGVRANFRSMLQALYRGIPLPLGAVDNRRSLVALDNLVDLVIRCTAHPAAAGRTFMASDEEDLSTPELLRRTASALGVRARLFSVPVRALELAGRATGRNAAVRRLCRSLQVSPAGVREVLGWAPPVGVDQALARTAAQFLESTRR